MNKLVALMISILVLLGATDNRAEIIVNINNLASNKGGSHSLSL